MAYPFPILVKVDREAIEVDNMKKFINDILLIPDDTMSFRDIIKFWESRRLRYNIIVGFFGILSLLVGSLITYKLINFFMLPFLIAYGIICNIFYTSGWICSLLLKEAFSKHIGKFALALFVVGTILSVIVTVLLVFSQVMLFL